MEIPEQFANLRKDIYSETYINTHIHYRLLHISHGRFPFKAGEQKNSA